jgi:hypothetical protein
MKIHLMSFPPRYLFGRDFIYTYMEITEEHSMYIIQVVGTLRVQRHLHQHGFEWREHVQRRAKPTPRHELQPILAPSAPSNCSGTNSYSGSRMMAHWLTITLVPLAQRSCGSDFFLNTNINYRFIF